MDLLKYLRCETTAKQNASIEAWVNENPENEKELLEIAKMFYAQKGKWDTSAAFKSVRTRINRRKTLRRFAYAFAFAVVVAVVNIAYWNIHPIGQDQYITLSSNAEKVVEYTLPDGSTVYLNRNSSITFPVRYAKKERSVKLDGEAFFEVAKDENKPFIVHTYNGIDVKVLGTKFNLDAFASDDVLRVSLIEGAVATYFTEGELKGKYIRLFPNDELRFNKDTKQYNLSSNSASDAAMWMKNTFVFNDTALPEILRRLSHEFNAEFIIQNEKLQTNRYSGTFDNRELSLILDYISMTSGVKITKEIHEGKLKYYFN